jgi:hypothetical protein
VDELDETDEVVVAELDAALAAPVDDGELLEVDGDTTTASLGSSWPHSVFSSSLHWPCPEEFCRLA